MSFGPQNLGQLAQALATSADGLLLTIRANAAATPNAPALANAVGQLAQASHGFLDAINAGRPLGVVAQAFGPVDALAGQIGQYLATNPVPPPVQGAWQAFGSIAGQIPQNLGPPPAQPGFQPAPAPYPPAGVSPVVVLSDQLFQEASAFVATFAPTAGRVPDGRVMLAEAQQLQAAAAQFRQVSAAGLPPAQLAQEFAGVAACCQRLNGHVAAIAQGRTGPNIQQVQKLGMICARIGQTLGQPGFGPF